MKVVICENCFNIPKITILNNSKVRIECEKCNESRIENTDYFDKFIKDNHDKLFDLDKCNYDNHVEEKNSTLYCFQCNKYICKDCLDNIHNKSRLQNHSTIKQKLLNEYYCKKLGHEEYILDHYCTKCKDYLCPKCKCEHKESDIFNFEKQDKKIREIKDKIKKCEEIINIEENYLKNYIKIIQNKIDILNNLFKDYKNRNLNSISIYKLLIDNYEQTFNIIRNYNVYYNININDNFDLDESTIYSKECLISSYNRLSAFYMNTNHIKTKEYSCYYITEKYCDKNIKKCIIINNNIIAYIYEEKLQNISFLYKIKGDSTYHKFNIFFENFIKDIYTLNKNEFIYLDYSGNLTIDEIFIKGNSLEANKIKTFQNINYCFIDLYSNNKFFILENKEQFLNLIYCFGKKYENNNLISKENKKYNIKYIIDDIREIVDNSNINNREKSQLKSIFKYEGVNDEKLEKLININKQFLQFFDNKNKDLYNRIKNKINENEDKYMLNSNYIYKTFKRLKNNLNNYNLTEEEKEEIKYIDNLNIICRDILDIYINYIIFNSKINNIYNYKNSFILFMGENYFLMAYSLKEKKFNNLASINFFINVENFKDFELIKITSDKVIINDSKNKIIYFIENNKNYDFRLLKKNIKYNSKVTAENNYLLYDEIVNNKLQFSFIDLSNFSNIENNNFIELLNFKINYNLPKILLNKEFKKIINIYDNNQLCIIDYIYKNELINENVHINEINLIKDNESEIIPPSSTYSSIYNEDYSPKNLFIENEYYCSKSNNNEFIQFDFQKEYCFNKIVVTYIDKYTKGRLKKFNIIYLDKKMRVVDKFECNNKDKELDYFTLSINVKGRYIKFEFLENFGENYFVIGKINFFVDEVYSIK